MEKIDHIVKQLRQLAFCLDTFIMGGMTAEEYHTSFSGLSNAGKSAFTKAILVDYAAVFMTHEFDEKLSGQISTRYLTKSIEFDNDLHAALLEVRHNFVAHATPATSNPRRHL